MTKVMKMVNNDKFAEIDKLFKELDMDEETIESLRNKLSDAPKTSKIQYDEAKPSVTTVKRPTIPDVITVNFKTRYEYFMYCINNVNYGQDNANQYVKGHIKALNKAIIQSKMDPNNLHLVEASINDELNTSISKNTLEGKGYYDGLTYVSKALKKSKEIMANKINLILKEELK